MVRNPPSSPLNYPANNTDVVLIFSYDRLPTTADFQNFKIRDFWIDNSSNDLWFLVDKAIGSGTWILLGGSGVSTESLTGNTGGPVLPDSDNNIDFKGEAPFTVVGTPGTNSLEIQNDGTLAESYVTDSGTAAPAADVLNVLGGGAISTSGAGSTITISSMPTLVTSNIGFTLAAGVFTITGADGNALSASNPATVRLPSKSAPGTFVFITVTAGQSFEDAAGTSTLIGNLFGLTTSIAHTDAIPFFLYAVLNDDEDDIAFMISRFPLTSGSPVNTKIGQASSAIADTQGSFYSLPAITATEWDSNPCERIGSFRMTMGATDDWTVSALANNDGIGAYQQDTRFLVTIGTFGAKASNVFIDNGGTAPTISGGTPFAYEIVDDQLLIDLAITFTGNGLGAVFLVAKMPYLSAIGGLVTAGNFMVVDSSFVPTWIGTTMVTSPSNDMDFFATNPSAIRQLINTDAISGEHLFARAIFPILFS